MANLNLVEVWKLIIGTQGTGQSGLNNVNFLVTAITGTGATDAQFVAAWDAILSPLYRTLMTDGAQYYGCKAVRFSPLPVAVPVVSANHTVNGDAGTTPLPQAVAGLIKFLTGVIGRKGRGRIYVPFPDAAFNVAHEPSGAYLTALSALATALNTVTLIGTSPNTSTVALCICAKPTKTFPAPTPYLVDTWVAEDAWGTQHRRGDFGRLNPAPPVSI